MRGSLALVIGAWARAPRASAVLAAIVSGLLVVPNQLSSEATRVFVWDARLRSFSGLAALLHDSRGHPDTEPGVAHFRPLANAVDWLAWQLVRSEARAHHAIDLALHALCAAIVVEVLLDRGTSRGAAATAGLAFAAHPAAIHTIGPNAGRPIVVAMAIALAALRVEKRARDSLAAVLVGLATLGAALAHEMFVVLPVLFGAVALQTSRRRAVIVGGASALAAIGFVALFRPSFEASWTAGGVVPRRLLTLLGLADPVIAFTPTGGAPWLLVALALALAPALVLFTSRRPYGLALAGGAFAFAALVASAPGACAWDRQTYPLLFGAVLSLAPLLDLVPSAVRARTYVALAPAALALVLLPFDWSNAVAWKSDETLLVATEHALPDDLEGRLAGALLRPKEEMAQASSICAEYAATGRSSRADACVARASLIGGSRADALHFARRYVDDDRDHEPYARTVLVEALLANDRDEEAASRVAQWNARYPNAADVLDAQRAIARRRGSK